VTRESALEIGGNNCEACVDEAVSCWLFVAVWGDEVDVSCGGVAAVCAHPADNKPINKTEMMDFFIEFCLSLRPERSNLSSASF